MFDLKLFSNSMGNYITRLDNGTFEVKIPISDNLKGKNLVVYYVNENNKIIEYQVTIDNDNKYAIFTTDHFSIYTLAQKPTNSTTTNNNNIITPTTTNNPQTKDNITIYILLLGLSIIGLTKVGLYIRKRKFN